MISKCEIFKDMNKYSPSRPCPGPSAAPGCESLLVLGGENASRFELSSTPHSDTIYDHMP